MLKNVGISKTAFAAAGIAALIACMGNLPALAQGLSSSDESQSVGDEPGRQSSEQVVIKEGPYRRQIVDFHTNQPAGTMIIRTQDRFLYLVLGDNRAMRYGIGVGRTGFQWSGTVSVSRKAEWPDWTPPSAMIARQPYLPRFMAGGPGNPLGARAMYLGSTDYRIHGTNQPETIGTSVSSGCFRLANGDIVDLFSRVNVGAKVIIEQGSESNVVASASTELDSPNN